MVTDQSDFSIFIHIIIIIITHDYAEIQIYLVGNTAIASDYEKRHKQPYMYS